MNTGNPLSLIGPIALLTPLLVAVIVALVARRESVPIPRAPLALLASATAASLFVFFIRPSGWFVLIAALALLVAGTLPALGAIERRAAERSRHEALERTAGLAPRAAGSYVGTWSRFALSLAVLSLLTWIGVRIASGEGATFTFLFGGAGLVFFSLYEVWLRDEVSGVRAPDEADRRRRVRAVFVAQTLLTTSFLVMAGLSTFPWPGHSVLGAAAALLGSAGSALALSTGIQKRYLELRQADR